MNFCIEEIGTVITTRDVELDGNEVKNLLDADPNDLKQLGFGIRQKGFLTTNFVRPPVTIFLKFPSCVEISHILINPKLGSQTSSAFMIQTETTASKGITQKHVVAKEYLDAVPNRIVFRNPRFMPRPPFSLLATSSYKSKCNDGEEKIFNLKHPSIQALEKVIGLEVTILRVLGSSVPALGGLQVWGQPCARCSNETTNKLLVKWMRRTRKPEAEKLMATDLKTKNEDDDEPASKRLKVCSPNSLPIPEEFLDPITQTIMCQPIRLPCGNAVDLTTLEKYYYEESIWGRPPNNPFTGQRYTENIKPIADAALKSRIDYFLTQNSDIKQLQTVSRTLGTVAYSSLANTSQNVYPRSSTLQDSSVYMIPTPTIKDAVTTISSFSMKHQNKTQHNATSTACNLLTSDLSMEDHLKKEMNKLLGNGSLYIAKAAGRESKGDFCIKCLNESKESSNKLVFYRSQNCPHVVICRACLLCMDKEAIMHCCHCDTKWMVKDLHRLHAK